MTSDKKKKYGMGHGGLGLQNSIGLWLKKQTSELFIAALEQVGGFPEENEDLTGSHIRTPHIKRRQMRSLGKAGNRRRKAWEAKGRRSRFGCHYTGHLRVTKRPGEGWETKQLSLSL